MKLTTNIIRRIYSSKKIYKNFTENSLLNFKKCILHVSITHPAKKVILGFLSLYKDMLIFITVISINHQRSKNFVKFVLQLFKRICSLIKIKNIFKKLNLYLQDFHIFVMIHSHRAPLILFISVFFLQNGIAACDWLTDFRSYFFSSSESSQEKDDQVVIPSNSSENNADESTQHPDYLLNFAKAVWRGISGIFSTNTVSDNSSSSESKSSSESNSSSESKSSSESSSSEPSSESDSDSKSKYDDELEFKILKENTEKEVLLYLETLPMEQQTEQIAQHLYLKVLENKNLTPFNIKTIVSDTLKNDFTQTIWKTEEVAAEISGINYANINVNPLNLNSIQLEILAHINVNLVLTNFSLEHDIDFEELLKSTQMYNEIYSKQFTSK